MGVKIHAEKQNESETTEEGSKGVTRLRERPETGGEPVVDLDNQSVQRQRARVRYRSTDSQGVGVSATMDVSWPCLYTSPRQPLPTPYPTPNPSEVALPLEFEPVDPAKSTREKIERGCDSACQVDADFACQSSARWVFQVATMNADTKTT